MHKINSFILMVLAALSTLLFISCEDDNNPAVNPLTASAGLDITTVINAPIPLDGTASKDAEGKAFTYAWSIASKPDQSSPRLQNESLSIPTFTPDKPGVYAVQLKISRGEWSASDMAVITVTEENGPVIISENITQDRVLQDVFPNDWTKADYLVTRSVSLSARLTIHPGVKIAFAEDALFTVLANGNLIAEGGNTQASNIYFAGQIEESAYWAGILFHSTKADNKLNHVQLSHAGSLPHTTNLRAGMLLKNNSKISITNSRFSDNAGHGLFAESTAALIEFDFNRFASNTGSPIVLPARQVQKLGSNTSFNNNNGINVIEVRDGILNAGTNHYWKAMDAPYFIADDLLVSANTGLHLAAGSWLKVGSDKNISIQGGAHLHVNGTSQQLVHIEGLEAVAGFWRGILIQQSAENSSELANLVLQHAGKHPIIGDRKNSIHIGAQGKVSINHSLIANGAGDGVDASASSAKLLSFQENSIESQAGYPLVVSTTNVAILDYNTHFSGNGKADVRVDPGNSIQSSTETVWNGFSQGTAYLIKGVDSHLNVQSGFRLNQGVILKFQEGISLIVNDANGHQAYLKIAGTAAKKVVLRGETETAGHWYGITVSSNNANNQIDHAQIMHAGKLIGNSFSASIVVDNAPMGRLSIINSTISNSAQHGISVARNLEGMLYTNNMSFVAVPATNIYVW